MKHSFKFYSMVITAILTLNSCTKDANQEKQGSLAKAAPKEINEEDLLGTKFIVATFEGNLKEGDEMDLTFDKDSFLKEYEKTLNNETKEEWVSEDVRAFAIASDDKKRIVPIIQFSSYNVSKEESTNAYYILQPIKGDEKMAKARYTFSACDTNVVCNSMRPCGGESGYCSPHYGSDYFGCTRCPIEENCQEQSSIHCGIARCIMLTMFTEKVMCRLKN